jgi:acetylcholinesterase
VFAHLAYYFTNPFRDTQIVIKRNKSIPIIGSFHGSDLPLFFDSGEMQDYLIHFAQEFNPNTGSSLPHWPQYEILQPQLLTLWDGPIPINITSDTFRLAAIAKLIELEYQKV